jgi:two-component system OmpR family response regulator
VFIGRVRKKIGPERIETVRGLGYRLTCPAEEESDAGPA